MTSTELKTLLTENSITQSELARQMSKNKGYVSLINRWYLGTQNMTPTSWCQAKLAVQAINRKRKRVKDKFK